MFGVKILYNVVKKTIYQIHVVKQKIASMKTIANPFLTLFLHLSRVSYNDIFVRFLCSLYQK